MGLKRVSEINGLIRQALSDDEGYLNVCYKNQSVMLYREIMAVCSEIHTKHINSAWAERGIVEC